jgi:DNA polymerase-4
VFDVLRSFTPQVEALSVDEAFLDVSGLRLHYSAPVDVAEAIRARIRTDVGLPASVGIAPTMFIAKLASEEAKPDGVHHVRAGDELRFLHPLPVRRLWGVGEATHAALEGLGVVTIGDLAALPPGLVERRLGRAVGTHLSALSHGIDPRRVQAGGGAKSISVENTFDRDLRSDKDIQAALLALCHRLDARLRRAAARGHTVSLKVRFDDFTTVTRSETSPDAVAHAADVFPVIRLLWSRVDRGGSGVRLLGVAVSGLESRTAPEQMLLGDDHHGAAAAIDEIRQRFGDDAVVPGGLLPPQTGAPDAGREATNSSGS